MSDKEGRKEFPFVSSVFRWFWRDLVKCYVSVQVTYLLDNEDKDLFSFRNCKKIFKKSTKCNYLFPLRFHLT